MTAKPADEVIGTDVVQVVMPGNVFKEFNRLFTLRGLRVEPWVTDDPDDLPTFMVLLGDELIKKAFGDRDG